MRVLEVVSDGARDALGVFGVFKSAEVSSPALVPSVLKLRSAPWPVPLLRGTSCL